MSLRDFLHHSGPEAPPPLAHLSLESQITAILSCDRRALRKAWSIYCLAKRSSLGGRPKVMRPCKRCGIEFSAVDLRKHKCSG